MGLNKHKATRDSTIASWKMQLIQEKVAKIQISGLKGMLTCYTAKLATIQNLFLCDLALTYHEKDHFLDIKRPFHLYEGY